MSQINIQKSIDTKRIKHINKLYDYSSIISFLLITSPILYLFFSDFYLSINIAKPTSLILPSILSITLLLIAIAFYKNDKFKITELELNEKNKKIISDYLNKQTIQKNWNLLKDLEQLKIIEIPMSEIQFGHYNKLFLMYNNEKIFINFSSYARVGFKIPFNYFCNRYIENKISQKLIEKIKNAP